MERVESNLFKANKVKLKKDGHHKCFICGSTEKINTHHLVCPYARQKEVDYEKLKEACESIDVYGYGEEMKNIPITSVDDIRNLVNVCECHHKRADHGIHNIPFADWLMQKVRMENEDRKDV